MLEAHGDKVLLEIITRTDAFAGEVAKRSGLLLDTNAIKQDEPNRGRVYAIGPDVPADAEYRVGDLVIFHTKEIFQGFRWDDKDLVSMKHEEILAKLIEEAA